MFIFRLSFSVSLDSAQRHGMSHSVVSPSYCSVIKGPMTPLPHPYSFMESQDGVRAQNHMPMPAHLQPRLPPLSLLNLKSPLPAHLGDRQQSFIERTVLPHTPVKLSVEGVQPFHIEVTLPGEKVNGVNNGAIKKTNCDDDNYNA